MHVKSSKPISPFLNFLKKKKSLSALDYFQKAQYLNLLGQAAQKIISKRKNKDLLLSTYPQSEEFRLANLSKDLGYYLQNQNENSSLDVTFGDQHFDLDQLSAALQISLQQIDIKNFSTCLNINKLAILTVLIYLLENESEVVEVGAYKCGSTIFMAKLAKQLSKKITFYACDTFQGMPSASAPDFLDTHVYDKGLFSDNQFDVIQKKIIDEGLQDSIHLVKGNVEHTLSQLKLKNCQLLFLDTDQYLGTKAGLELIQSINTQPQVVIDDSSLTGVSQAVDEFIDHRKDYRRFNLIENFDYLFSSKEV